MVTEKARSLIRELDSEGDLSFLRLRSSQFEVLISPYGKSKLIVIQDHLKLSQ
jgi:hypothetical protein